MKIFKPSLLLAIASSLLACNHLAVEQANSTQKLVEIKQVAQSGPFKPSWDSLSDYKIPKWYKDSKFGIFIHWGVYSVPAYNGEWYPRWMYDPDYLNGSYYKHHNDNHGPVNKFGYKDFIPMFKAEKFDATKWAQIFKQSGAKYVIPVAEHHDGFPMYDSQYTPWNAAKMGPKRDVIAELSTAIRKEGLMFGLSSHRAENWWFFGQGRKIESDVQDDNYRALYGPAMDRVESESGKTPPNKAFLDDWLLRTVEIVDKYQPQILWFDWWMATKPFQEHLKEFSAYYYNKGKTWDDMVAINYKKFGGESYPDSAGVLDIERGQLAEIREYFWQTDTSVSKNSWGYVSDHKYKKPGSIIDDLIDIVSKNGTLLLNIGPKPDGTIPEEEVNILMTIGDWLKLNGEAIYKTRPWITFGEGVTKVVDGTMKNDAELHRKDFTKDDIRFTQREGILYAILMDWPGNNKKITISSLTEKNMPNGIKSVTMLGNRGELKWSNSEKGMQITLPQKSPSPFAQVIKITPQQTLMTKN